MRRFFCENCGEEVKEREELCPYCGAIFQAIKCPQCGYRGKLHEFGKGCPACGFLGDTHVRETGAGPSQWEGTPVHDEARARASRTTSTGWLRLIFSGASEGAPAWLFWLVLALMVGAFTVLALLYMSL